VKYILARDLSTKSGIGGLGHLAIQFAAKSGYNVVALSQSDSKKDLAMKLGAHHYLSGKDVVSGIPVKSMALHHSLCDYFPGYAD
jgi:D-arabinose 1-dehydrogenase-like Zn-dependent alcohol dehydrogenase